ncbi:discoidin domain-containing protein [Rugosimonospora africana]|uniref:Probable beta-glucosidase G n=1 Tax=Rugosimonospora africana TaxID=556532 RepID=A0A8J3VV89_9ACTN|nr:discoidin domain-containing protein [Rugosimonospora africana]GIH20035.1 beta-glucosidase [Rugosimonospora africana]
MVSVALVPLRRARNPHRLILAGALILVLLAWLAVAVGTARAAATLLSQGRPATASSVENAGSPASAAVDGNTGTRWSSAFSDPQWLQVDLGSTATISQVVLQWESAYATAFQLQVSADASTWSTIYSTTTGTGGTQTLNVSGSGRYVRVYGTARATGYGYSLWEFQVYGTLGSGGGCGTADAALNKPATASSTENAGTPASAAVDGNAGTRWSSASSDPQWLRVDLGATVTVCQVGIQWEAAYASAFQIQVSNDGSTWSTIYSTTTGTGGTQALTVSSTGRYIRMNGTARATGYGYSIWEFTVNTTGGGTTSSPSPTPTTSPTGGGGGPTQYCGYQDLAVGQPTTASSTYSATANPASFATDGNPGSRWESAYSDPQWLEVDLGSQTQICGASLLWEAAYASAFQIQVSNDNATWSTVYSTTTAVGGSESLTVSATDRYIRVYATARATQWGDSILEFRVYGLTTVAPISGGNGNGGNGVCPWVNSTAPVAQRVQQVLNTMNQSEEFTLLSGDGGSSYIGQVAAIPNLCIKAMNMQDGPNGVGDGTGGVTAYPDGENAAATWDPALIQQEGAAMGAEFAGKGVNVSLGPTTNLVRDPRWGRTYETYGEDPYLAGRITAAEVTGLQSQGVQAMVKHVAAYDQEQYPNGNNNETVSEQALQELYLAPFQSAVYQSAPASFMCSYAVVNSAASCQNADMQIKGLNNEANFGGYITSDWGADYNNVASVVGGMEIGMPFPGSIATDMANAIANGTLSQYAVNAAVARILTQMFAFGMFDNPASGSLSSTVTSAAHQQTALQLSEEGSVLLKNNGILPLNPNGTESIAVIGTDAGAGVELAGGGSGTVTSSNTIWPITGIQNAVGSGVKVTYTAGNDNGTANIPQAVASARAATDAIIFVNLPEGEESDLTTLDLSSTDESMIQQVAAANPNTVVVLNSGGPVVMPWLNSVAAVFANWYPGQGVGNAMAALIFGTANPSGKLPVTFPSSLSQVPAQTQAQWPGTSTGVSYSEGVKIGYRWYQSQNITPAFPFGFGLSYTNFSFSNLNVGAFNANGTATVTATVTNTGSRAGAEVAQLYVSDPAASGNPPQQLAGFQRVNLNPGQSTTVSFTLTIHDLANWSTADNQWEAQAGTYGISVGDSSANRPLSATTSLAHQLTGQVAAGTSGAGISPANTAVSANVAPNSGVPGSETVGVVNPWGYSSPKGTAVSFAMQAVDSNKSETLTFTATGLPPGITIAANGTVSGTGTALGTYTATVTAKDSQAVTGTATFVWSVVQ